MEESDATVVQCGVVVAGGAYLDARVTRTRRGCVKVVPA